MRVNAGIRLEINKIGVVSIKSKNPDYLIIFSGLMELGQCVLEPRM